MRARTESESRTLRAEALFVSPLQPSEGPVATQIREAVGASLMRHGGAGCATLLAQEYGEHPAEAAGRMRWVLDMIDAAYPSSAANSDRPTNRGTGVATERGSKDWWAYAACAGHDPEWWSDNLAGRSRAARICATCPVRIPCLEEAIEHGDLGVVRGGVLLTHARNGLTFTPLFCQRCGVTPLAIHVNRPKRRICSECQRAQRSVRAA